MCICSLNKSDFYFIASSLGWLPPPPDHHSSSFGWHPLLPIGDIISGRPQTTYVKSFVTTQKWYIFVSIWKRENLKRGWEKEGQLLYWAQAFLFCPRNIKTQFEGNFFNRRLLKFPENCVLMFRGLKNRPGRSTKPALLFWKFAGEFSILQIDTK